MSKRLKRAVRVVDVRRMDIERELRSLQKRQAKTIGQIGLLEQQRETLERNLEANCPAPNTMIVLQELITLADESRQLRRAIVATKSEQKELQSELKNVDAACRSAARKLLALHCKSDFLGQQLKRELHKRRQQNAGGID